MTLSALVERALRVQLGDTQRFRRRAVLRWVTVEGGLPPGMTVSDRGTMHDSLRRAR